MRHPHHRMSACAHHPNSAPPPCRPRPSSSTSTPASTRPIALIAEAAAQRRQADRLSRRPGCRATRGSSGSTRRPGACSSSSATTTTRWSYGTPEAERLAAAAREHGITVVDGPAARGAAAASTSRSGSSTPDGETVAQRRKLKPTHVERTVFGEGDGSDLAVLRHGARPHRRAVLLGAPAAAVEVRDVRAERAGAHRGVAELLALPRRRLRARARRSTTRPAGSTRSRAVLRDRAVRHGLAGDDRAAVHRRPDEAADAAARRRLRRASTGPTAS